MNVSEKRMDINAQNFYHSVVYRNAKIDWLSLCFMFFFVLCTFLKHRMCDKVCNPRENYFGKNVLRFEKSPFSSLWKISTIALK
jgi:hypothetical protein